MNPTPLNFPNNKEEGIQNFRLTQILFLLTTLRANCALHTMHLLPFFE